MLSMTDNQQELHPAPSLTIPLIILICLWFTFVDITSSTTFQCICHIQFVSYIQHGVFLIQNSLIVSYSQLKFTGNQLFGLHLPKCIINCNLWSKLLTLLGRLYVHCRKITLFHLALHLALHLSCSIFIYI